MKKALIIGVLFAAGLFTMNAAYAGKNGKKSVHVDTVKTQYYIAEKPGVIWSWNSSTWTDIVHP